MDSLAETLTLTLKFSRADFSTMSGQGNCYITAGNKDRPRLERLHVTSGVFRGYWYAHIPVAIEKGKSE